jgi:hypothetical protein
MNDFEITFEFLAQVWSVGGKNDDYDRTALFALPDVHVSGSSIGGLHF